MELFCLIQYCFLVHHYAQIMNLKSIAGQHDAGYILSDVMNISLYCRQYDFMPNTCSGVFGATTLTSHVRR